MAVTLLLLLRLLSQNYPNWIHCHVNRQTSTFGGPAETFGQVHAIVGREFEVGSVRRRGCRAFLNHHRNPYRIARMMATITRKGIHMERPRPGDTYFPRKNIQAARYTMFQSLRLRYLHSAQNLVQVFQQGDHEQASAAAVLVWPGS